MEFWNSKVMQVTVLLKDLRTT